MEDSLIEQLISREIGQLFLFNNNARSQDFFPKRISENSIVLNLQGYYSQKACIKGVLRN